MYDEQFTAAPRDEDHFWRMVEDNLDLARHVLFDFPVESREEAVSGVYRTSGEKRTKLRPIEIISFRDVALDYDQRDYYLNLGRSTYNIVKELADRRRVTEEFAQAWGVLQFCHGYVASHVMDTTDTLSQARAATRSAEARRHLPQKVWFSRLAFMGRDQGLARDEIDYRLFDYIKAHPRSPEFPQSWFDVLLDKHELKGAFSGKRFSYNAMDELLKLGEGEVTPPLPEKFP